MAQAPVPPAPVALPPVSPDDISNLLDAFLAASREQKAWEEHKKGIAQKLNELHSQGLLPTKSEHAGFFISLQDGRKTIELDKVGKASIDLLKADLVKQGHGEEKVGAPFWVAREMKAK